MVLYNKDNCKQVMYMCKNCISNQKNIIIPIIPFIVFVAVIPLVIHHKVLPVEQAVQEFWNQGRRNTDYFSYYKSILIIAVTMFSFVLLFISPFSRKAISRNKLIIIPVIVYALCIIASTVFSEYRHTSVYGFPDRYEGALVLLSYLVMFFLSVFFIKEEVQIRIVVVSLAVSSVIIGIIGVMQVFGLDIFNTGFGKSLILSGNLKEYTGSIRATSVAYAVNTAVSTLYNSNVLGQYMSMIFPLIFTFFILTQSTKFRILCGAATFLIFANLIGSNSRASLISMILTVIIIVVSLYKYLITRWKQLITAFICFVLIFLLIDSSRGGLTGSRIASVFSMKDTHIEDNDIDKIKNFKIQENQLVLECTNSSLTLDVSDNYLRFINENGVEMKPSSTQQDTEITLEDDKYKHFTFIINKNLIKIRKGKSFLYFAVLNNKFQFLDRNGIVINDLAAKRFGFESIERFASGRGYIWSGTIPLLPRSILWGFGPDTFAMYFPQHDFKGKLNFMYDAYLIIDKPHNLYLQMAVNTGVLSLAAFLFIVGYYIIGNFRSLRMGIYDNFACKVRLAVLASIIGYLLSGLSTDSTVSVAPVFWILLGLGISIKDSEPGAF